MARNVPGVQWKILYVLNSDQRANEKVAIDSRQGDFKTYGMVNRRACSIGGFRTCLFYKKKSLSFRR